jgi:hypothetical protein
MPSRRGPPSAAASLPCLSPSAAPLSHSGNTGRGGRIPRLDRRRKHDGWRDVAKFLGKFKSIFWQYNLNKGMLMLLYYTGFDEFDLGI